MNDDEHVQPCARCGVDFSQPRVRGRRRIFHEECARIVRREKRAHTDALRRERYHELLKLGAEVQLAAMGCQGEVIYKATKELLMG